jgi:hypothetical protein
MLKKVKEKWWLYTGIIVFLIIRTFIEPFRSNILLAMLAAVVIGIVIVILMAIIPKSSQGA